MYPINGIHVDSRHSIFDMARPPHCTLATANQNRSTTVLSVCDTRGTLSKPSAMSNTLQVQCRSLIIRNARQRSNSSQSADNSLAQASYICQTRIRSCHSHLLHQATLVELNLQDRSCQLLFKHDCLAVYWSRDKEDHHNTQDLTLFVTLGCAYPSSSRAEVLASLP